MTDFIIVGCGLAGIAFAETALQHGCSVKLFDDNSQTSSRIAAGLYNPVILKRFSQLNGAQQQLDEMRIFYSNVEQRLGIQLNFPLAILRKFASVEEQNNWFAASDKPGLSPFLSQEIINKHYSGIDSEYGFGQVLQTGYVDTELLLNTYQKYLEKNGMLQRTAFDHSGIVFNDDGTVSYANINARHIIFAEGFGMHNNPFFKSLPLDGTKGELLVIKARNLSLDVVINTSVFLLPLGNGYFKVGATYNWFDKTNDLTDEGRAELIGRISEIINCDYEIVAQYAGVRPTVKDRKALLGTHPEHSQLHILNGLGTRGVMLGPMMARILYEHIELGNEIPKEISISRFNRVPLDRAPRRSS